MKPKLSYTIWFSQRTGSTLLSKALAATGIAGIPYEWLYTDTQDLMMDYGARNHAHLQEILWEKGSTPNGVCGVKVSFVEPHITKVMDTFKQFPGEAETRSGSQVWEKAFPNCRHIFMTRRNKVRLAVSWWKAIKSGEWHRKQGQAPTGNDVADDYSFDAINHLLIESALREAGIQEFLSEKGIVPMTIVYEDFIRDYEGTVRGVLEYLDLPGHRDAIIEPPYFDKLADELSEQWVQRFRQERQAGWDNRGW